MVRLLGKMRPNYAIVSFAVGQGEGGGVSDYALYSAAGLGVVENRAFNDGTVGQLGLAVLGLNVFPAKATSSGVAIG